MLFDNTELSTQFESRTDVKLFSKDKVKILNILQNPPAVMVKACGMGREGEAGRCFVHISRLKSTFS